MSWNYADLCKNAKLFDGPEEYVKAIQQAGEIIGRNQMVPYVIGAFGIGCLVTNYFNTHYDLKQRENVDTIKMKFLKSIKTKNKECNDKPIINDQNTEECNYE